MAKAKKQAVKKTAEDAGKYIIQNLVLRAVNRRQSDVGDWRNAQRSAENVQNPNRTNLYDLYADILLDPTLSSVIDKRIMAITNTPLRYVKNGKDVEELRKLTKTEAFKDLLREIMLAKMWGISVVEINFNATLNIFSIPRKHLRPHRGEFTRHQNDMTGTSYREGMFLNTILEVGKPDDLGLLLKAVPYVLYKRGAMGDWAQFSEIFGMPMRVGRYSGYDEATRIALEKALDESGSALSITLPDEAKIEILESKSTGDGSKVYDALKNACNDELAILILGQTGTTRDSESSGYAQAKVHSKTEDEINLDDKDFVISILESKLGHIFQQAGLPMEGGEWLFEDPEEDISLKDRVTIDTALKASGLPIDDDYFYERYNIPKPENYEALKKEAAQKEAAKGLPAGQKEKLSDDEVTQTKSLLDRLKDFFA